METDAISCRKQTEWVKYVTFPGSIAPFTSDKKEAAKKDKRHTNRSYERSLWMNGSHLRFRRTGVSIAWKQTMWKRWEIYLEIKKGVFDAELYTTGEALRIALIDFKTGW